KIYIYKNIMLYNQEKKNENIGINFCWHLRGDLLFDKRISACNCR
ncbi:unnamed protein product, partial [marine sediment metagenome]